jgi:hypothetical protein
MGKLLTQCCRKAVSISRKVADGMLCRHRGRETDQNRVVEEVYDDGKWTQRQTTEKSCCGREITKKCGTTEKIAQTRVMVGRDVGKTIGNGVFFYMGVVCKFTSPFFQIFITKSPKLGRALVIGQRCPIFR